MSVVLVCFPGAPKISEEAVKKEEELDKYLEARVEGERSDWHRLLHLWDISPQTFSAFRFSYFPPVLIGIFPDCCRLTM